MNHDHRTVSVVISAYNAEHSLASCLESVSWADEIVVIDNESTDKTAMVAKKYTKNVFTKENNLMLNVNKNFGFSKATGDWILNVDADEQIPSSLAKEIRHVLDLPAVEGYWIPRKNIIFGKWIAHGLWWPDKQLRLFRRGSGSFPCTHVHEYIRVDGQTGELSEPFLHHNYRTIDEYLYKMEHIYIKNEADNLEHAGYRVYWADAIRFPLSDFLKTYFAQSGYKDGIHGLVLSMLQAFYSFLVFATLWERQGFAEIPIQLSSVHEESRISLRDIRYWLLHSEINEIENPVKKLIARLYRKLFSRLL